MDDRTTTDESDSEPGDATDLESAECEYSDDIEYEVSDLERLSYCQRPPRMEPFETKKLARWDEQISNEVHTAWSPNWIFQAHSEDGLSIHDICINSTVLSQASPAFREYFELQRKHISNQSNSDLEVEEHVQALRFEHEWGITFEGLHEVLKILHFDFSNVAGAHRKLLTTDIRSIALFAERFELTTILNSIKWDNLQSTIGEAVLEMDVGSEHVVHALGAGLHCEEADVEAFIRSLAQECGSMSQCHSYILRAGKPIDIRLWPEKMKGEHI